MRINKYIAASSSLSRRGADDAIISGRVTYNGELVTTPGIEVRSGDVVTLDAVALIPHTMVYYALHKPVGYTTTTSDPYAKKVITTLLPQDPPLFPVGRLDKNSRGLLLCTNDGDFAFALTHPSQKHTKEYLVTVNHRIDLECISKLQTGITLEEGVARVDEVKLVSEKVCKIILHQGWKRQIRRMMSACGYEVVDLFRTRVGKLQLGKLAEGEYQSITPHDVI